MSEAGEARWMLGHRAREPVVHVARKRHPLGPIEQIGRRSHLRQHLHRDPRGVHVLEATCTEVGQLVAVVHRGGRPVPRGPAALGNRTRGDARYELGNGEVLFECDDSHWGAFQRRYRRACATGAPATKNLTVRAPPSVRDEPRT